MPKGVVYALKIIWYILRTAVVIGVAAGLFVLAFYTAMDMANVYIITTDGMKRRADAILLTDTAAELIEYYTPEFLEGDMLLYSLPYTNYTIRSFEHKVNVSWISIWPWKDEAIVTVRESVQAIDGALQSEKQEEGQTDGLEPPEWENYAYHVHLIRDAEGRFYINELEKTERIEESAITPAPTIGPDTTLTPRPTPTPAAQPETGGV